LNVSKSASQEEVKSSFLHLSKIHHPDAGGSTEQFQLLQDAFEHLKKDFKKRKVEKEEYDEYTPMVFTKFGPTENDAFIVGDCLGMLPHIKRAISSAIFGYMNFIPIDCLKPFTESILESTYIKIERYMNCVYFNQLYIIYIFSDK